MPCTGTGRAAVARSGIQAVNAVNHQSHQRRDGSRI